MYVLNWCGKLGTEEMMGMMETWGEPRFLFQASNNALKVEAKKDFIGVPRFLCPGFTSQGPAHLSPALSETRGSFSPSLQNFSVGFSLEKYERKKSPLFIMVVDWD